MERVVVDVARVVVKLVVDGLPTSTIFDKNDGVELAMVDEDFVAEVDLVVVGELDDVGVVGLIEGGLVTELDRSVVVVEELLKIGGLVLGTNRLRGVGDFGAVELEGVVNAVVVVVELGLVLADVDLAVEGDGVDGNVVEVEDGELDVVEAVLDVVEGGDVVVLVVEEDFGVAVLVVGEVVSAVVVAVVVELELRAEGGEGGALVVVVVDSGRAVVVAVVVELELRGEGVEGGALVVVDFARASRLAGGREVVTRSRNGRLSKPRVLLAGAAVVVLRS